MLRTTRVPLSRLLHDLRSPSILPQHVLHPPTTLRTLALTNPSTNTTITHVPLTLPSTLDDLLPTQKVITQWRESSLPTRLSYLRNLENLIRRHARDLAYLIHLEIGNPISEAMAEVDYALNILSWSSQPALHAVRTSCTRYSPHHRTHSTISPVGAVLAISPFNLPLAIAIRKLAPALACGCTVVAKPSEKAVLPALALGKLVEEAGFPKGVFTPIVGGAEVVKPLLTGDHIKMLSFTGSTSVGRMLQKQAGWRRCLLELGGNAAFIVFDECDMKKAVKDLVRNGLRCAGQTCIAANRVFVQEGIYEEFVEELGKRVQGAKIGPVIDEEAKEMVMERVRKAVDGGANIVVGGGSGGGCYVEATVLSEVEEGMEVVDEETFGPVFSVMKFGDEDQVVGRGNSGSSGGGLAGYVYSGDMGRCMRVVDRLNAGMIGVNSVSLSCGETEFGGIGECGLGREGGLGGVEAYCDRKYYVVQS